jgi:hypothetical protein
VDYWNTEALTRSREGSWRDDVYLPNRSIIGFGGINSGTDGGIDHD